MSQHLSQWLMLVLTHARNETETKRLWLFNFKFCFLFRPERRAIGHRWPVVNRSFALRQWVCTFLAEAFLKDKNDVSFIPPKGN